MSKSRWERFKSWLFMCHGEDEHDCNASMERELKEVEWQETVTETHVDVTTLLVWEAGAEREITYTEGPSDPRFDHYIEVEEDGTHNHLDIRVGSAPAYREAEYEEWEREYETTVTAWVTEVPPGVEETGRTKTVVEYDE